MKKNYTCKKYRFAKIMLALVVLLSCTWSINAQQYSLDFDGTNDHVSFNTPSGFPIGSSPYTLEAWVYPDAMGDKGIVGWGNYGVTNGANALRLLPNGIRHYWWGNDLDATTTTLTGAWHHIAATCSSTERKIYLDGVLVASQNVTVSQHTVPAPTNLTIGKTSSNEIFDGKIDNVRIWTVARTQEEIQAGMTASYGAGTPGLAASYNFNEGSGTLLTDSVNPSANNGTLRNFALSGTTSNWVAAIPAIRYVKQGGTGNGTSWAAASGDLQGMINLSVAVDEVWVAAGTYQRGAGESFSMKSGVKIYGGFPAAGNPGMADRNLAVNFTILQGNGNRVIMNNNIDTAARLDGFVIQGGQLSGVECGAGVYNLNSSPIIANCIIRNNTTPEWGGGFYNRFGNAKIVNCVIYGNTAGGGGGAFEHGAQSTFANCTFSANNSNVNGGAVHTHENGTLTLNNSILWSNNAAAAGDEVFTTGSSTVAAFYSIVANEAGDISGNFAGTTAIYANPGFTDATNNNYTLAFDSPALNTGNNSYISGYTTDLAGNPRINSVQVDMGPYERQFAIQPDSNGIMYVKKGATGEGASWNNAVGELADALKQAKFINDATPEKVKQIWVAKGTYKPMYRADNLNSTNTTAYENAFILVNNVKVYGNFAGTESSFSDRSLGNTANKTILSGDFSGNDTYGPTGQATANYAENAEHVVMAAGVGTPELDGFTITGGNATYNTNYITVNGATMIASNKGGGLYVINSQPIISNIIFKGNRAGDGGGIYNINSAAQFKNILIAGNTSLGFGGGYSNSGNSGEPTLTNITIAGNNSASGPAGIYTSNSAPVHLKNSIVWGNTYTNPVPSTATAIRNYNNIIEGSYVGNTTFNTDFGLDMGGNSGADPLFTNAAAGDFTLTALSPAVNSGNNSSFNDAQNSKDILGNPRVTASVIDMGAYEHTNPVQYAPNAGGILYVVKGAAGTGNSWNNAIGELALALKQAKALNDAVPETVKQIWVAKGTYKPLYRLGWVNNSPLDKNNAFVVSNDVKVYGHFAGTETALAQRDFSNAANKTILSGDITGNDTYGSDGQLTANFNDNAYHVVIAATATGLEMNGFTVTGGNAVSTISTTVNSNAITGNMGSGIYAAYGTPLFTNIIVKGNRDTYGASVYAFDSNAIFKNMLITGNYSSNSVSGFQIGGTMGAPNMINSTITKNNSPINTSGIATINNGAAYIYNSILYGNTATQGSAATPNVRHYNNIVQGSISGGSWSNNFGVNMGANSSSDPLFTNFSTGDFTLQSASPAVDSGANSYFPGAADAKDIAGNNRLRGASIDIGVYESAFFGPVDANGVMYVVKGAAGQGSSWNNAVGELADALKNAKRLNDAIPGRVKQIWAAKGVYKPIYRADNLDSNQPTSTINSFVLVNDVKVYGHFAGAETALAERNFADAANKTTLSGDLGNNDTYSASGHLTGNFYDNVAHVVICAGTGVPELDGFTIKGGYGSGSNITVNGVSGIPAINGSGIMISNSQPIISNIILTGNRDYAGGTIWNENSASQFFNLVIASNTSQTACAGFCQTGTLATPVITNATITKNTSVNSLTGIAAISGTVDVKNSIIWDNTTNSNTSFAGVRHYNNLIQGGTNGDGSFNTQVGEDMGGNINADPLFADAANGNYTIPFTSPAANAGNTSSYANADSATDVAGNPRLDGSSIDMGAYESIMPPPPEIRYVKQVATGTGDGSDWDNASADIQAMINGAGVEQVWVAAGTYKPTIIAGNGYDDRNKAFVLKSDVKVYGGFAGYETDLEDRDWEGNVTTLSGDLGSVNNISDNACHVVISVDDVGTAVLDGFTITGGNTLYAESITINSHYIMSSYGSGIFCVESSPAFSNLIITGNRATNAGGGVHIGVGSWPLFSNVVISNNTCTSNVGGGMHNWGSPILINVTIRGNTGSGIESQSISSPILTNVTVTGNTGNGIKIGSGPFKLNNCTISGNGSYGLIANGATVLNNTIVYGNQYGIMGSPTFNNSLVQGITDVSGGNISGLVNPLFVNASSYTTAPFTGGDYRLEGCSPVLNMGNNEYVATETDLEGSPRIYNDTVDLGAYEFQSVPVSVSPAEAEAQIFEPGATVADLVATGNDLKWYDVATFGTPLAGSTQLISGTYYVTQTIDGCESPRTSVAVTINYPVILYVKPIASGSGDGTSWDNASDDIQAMINTSGADQVWVAAGTYKPAVMAGNGSDERNKAFVLKNDVQVYGGFTGNESDIADRDWENNVTILSGDLGVENDSSDNAYHIIISTGDVGIAQLDGFSITGANSDGYDVVEVNGHYMASDYGSGIICVASSPVFANLIVTGNRANYAGAGVYNELGSSSVFSNVVISNNEVSAGAGAGMYNNESSPILNNVTISGNTGDGIENNSNASPVLNNVAINGNTNNGITNTASVSILNNVVVSGNGDYGIITDSPVTLNNSTVSGNGFYGLLSFSTVVLNNTIVYGNQFGVYGSVTYNNSLVQEITEVSEGNISGLVDPVFVDAPSYTVAPFTGGDYSLRACSPVLNRGNNDYVNTATDLAGNPRIYNNTVDLGAYEYQSLPGGAPAPGAQAQVVILGATVANLVAAGSNLKWYDVPTMGAPLDGSTQLLSGTYYVSQTVDGCESPRTAVSVTVNYPAIVYVRTNASGDGTGTSWANASAGLQAMVNAPGVQQVWVAAGSYQPAAGQSFTMKTNVKIYGGFPATGSPALAQRNVKLYETILSGNGNRVIDNNSNALTATAILDGFIIEGGAASDNGGGMRNINSYPAISNCIFRDNTAGNWGGAMLNQGNGIVNVTNCLFYHNQSTGGGANFDHQNAKTKYTNVTFADNISSGNGGAVHTYTNAAVTFYNCIFYGNTAGSSGNNIMSSGGGTIMLYKCMVTPGNYGLSGGYSSSGLISGNPLFKDAANGDYSLQPLSPAIDAGTTSYFAGAATAKDLAGSQRLYGAAIDLGPYEYKAYCTITTIWDGDEWTNGEPVAYEYAAVINGDYNSADNGEITACSLTVNSGDVVVSSGDVFTIKGAVMVNEAASLTFENNAHLMQEENTNTNAGNTEVHRNSSQLFRQDYTMWSSPVEGQEIRDFSPETLYNRFYTYNPVTNHLVSMFASEQASDGVNFATGQGYLIRMPNGAPEAGYVEGTTSIIYDGTFTGEPNNGDMQIAVTPASPGVLGYNAIGNPYPSPISIPAFFAANNGNTDGAIYLWRRKNGSDIASAYCTVNSVGEYVDNGQLETENPNGFIQTGQGFIVKALNSTVTFGNFMRSPTTAHDGSFFRMNNNTPPADEAHRIWLNLSKENAPVAQMLVGYRSNATMGIDMGIDAPFINDVQTGLNSLLDDKAYAIQGRSLPFNNQDVVALQFKAEVAGSYSIAIDHLDGLFLENQDIYLKDNLLNVTHDIKASNYSFTSGAGIFNDRFEIVYVTNALGTDEPKVDANTIIIYKQDKNIIINSGTAVMANVKVFDTRGRLVYERSGINASETVISDLRAEEQMLIVQVTTIDGGKVSKKVIY